MLRTHELLASIATIVLVGLLLTVLSMVSGFWLIGWKPSFGVTSSIPDHENEIYDIGWTVSESGVEISLDSRHSLAEYRNILFSARRSGRPWQKVTYFHEQRGYPWGWFRYFSKCNERVGSFGNVAQARVRFYPAWRFDCIRWGAFLASLGFWSFVASLSVGVFQYVRWLLVRRTHERAVCAGCGYSLRGLSEPRCPECGISFDPDKLRTSGQSVTGRNVVVPCATALLAHRLLIAFAPADLLSITIASIAIQVLILSYALRTLHLHRGVWFVFLVMIIAYSALLFVHWFGVLAGPFPW